MNTSQTVFERKRIVLELIELLRENREIVFERVFNTLFDIVFICDTEKNVVDVSPSIQRALGYTEAEIEGNSIYTISNDNELLNKVFANLSNGVKNVFQVAMISKTHDKLWFEVFATSVKIQENHFYIVIASDVTAKKYAEEQLMMHSQNIEKQLEKEKELRLQKDKFSLQKQITQWLILLIGAMVLLPYVISLFIVVPNDLTNNAFNVVLIIVGSLAVAVSSIFNKKEDDKPRE